MPVLFVYRWPFSTGVLDLHIRRFFAKIALATLVAWHPLAGAYIFYFKSMDSTAKSVKIVALYVFPGIILVLMTILFIVPIPKSTGTLEGQMSVGPICPVERVDTPCPVPPSAYTSRTILIYPKGSEILTASVHPDATGAYKIKLPVNTYVVKLGQNGIDKSADVPRTIHIDKDGVTRVDIAVDTGIR